MLDRFIDSLPSLLPILAAMLIALVAVSAGTERISFREAFSKKRNVILAMIAGFFFSALLKAAFSS